MKNIPIFEKPTKPMIRFIRIGKTEWDIESHIGYADKNLRKRFTALVKNSQ